MMRLPWRGKAVPHAVLDILRGCNCRCRHCYNGGREPVCKSREELRGELSVLRSCRNLKTVSLSGGEPLMHPQILDIVRWLRWEEGLTVNTLTNGILLDDAMAAKLADAGLGMITIHVQKGQDRPDADDAGMSALLAEKGRIARAHGIFPAADETVGADDADEFRRFGLFMRQTQAFEYALVTVAGDFRAIRADSPQADVDPSVLVKALDDVGYTPSAFVGGKYDPARPRWYVFQSTQAVDAAGRERGWNRFRPSWPERAFLRFYAKCCKRSIHWIRSSSAALKVRLLLNGLTGGHFSTFMFAAKAVLHGWRLLEKHIIVQLPPHSLGDGRVEICDNCPDATVRNGRLHPLCLNDLREEFPV